MNCFFFSLQILGLYLGPLESETLKVIYRNLGYFSVGFLDAPQYLKLSRSVMSDSCDPMDCSLTGSSVHGIFQARILEWVAISFSRGSSRPRDRTQVTCIVGRSLPSELPGKPNLQLKTNKYLNIKRQAPHFLPLPQSWY